MRSVVSARDPDYFHQVERFPKYKHVIEPHRCANSRESITVSSTSRSLISLLVLSKIAQASDNL